MADDRRDDISSAFRKTLDAHGFGFQARVLRECSEFGVKSSANDPDVSGFWRVIGEEVPISVNGEDHHIDGVLEFFPSNSQGLKRFIVLECKRANPSISHWAFARTDRSVHQVFLDQYHIERREGVRVLVAGACVPHAPHGETLQVGLELRTSKEGNEIGKTMKQAITQVFRGVSGLAARLPEWIDDRRPILVVPLIVTTAQLFVTSTRLFDADLESGNLPETPTQATSHLWHTVNLSQSQLPQVDRMTFGTVRSLEEAVAITNTRGVMIANASHIADALGSISYQTARYEAVRQS